MGQGQDREPARHREQAEDRGLRELFAALRRQEEAAAPPFRALRRRPPALYPRRLAAGLATLALAAAGLFAVWLWVRSTAVRPPAAGAPALSIAAWRAPTDFLLRVPGRELLAAAPSLGRIPSLGFAPRPPASDSGASEKERRIPR